MPAPLRFERILCRSCQDWRLHTVEGEPPQRTWVCTNCGTVERRNPQSADDSQEQMEQRGVARDRRAA